MEVDNSVKHSLELLSKRWRIDPQISDLHLGKRNDVVDTALQDFMFRHWQIITSTYCGGVCGQIVTIVASGKERLPLTKDDIEIIAKKMGYLSKAEFIRTETRISILGGTRSVRQCYNYAYNAFAKKEF